MPTFDTPRNNAVSTVASPYTAGSGTLVVADGSVFGTAFPARVSTFTAAGVPRAILRVTARTGNTLTVGPAIEGTTDTNLAVGDVVQMGPTAGQITDIQSAVNTNETAINAHVANVSNPHATTAAQVGAYTTAQTDALLAGKANTSHTHAAADITTGTIATARLGSGTANTTTFLRGDQSWAAPVASITLSTSGAIHTSPVTFTNTAGAWSGTLSLATQANNTVFAGPSSGGPLAPSFRQLGHSELSGLTSGDPHTQYLAVSPGSGRNVLQPSGSAVMPLEIRGAASQTADLTQWTNSSGTVLGVVDASGRMAIGRSSVAVIVGTTFSFVSASPGTGAFIALNTGSSGASGGAGIIGAHFAASSYPASGDRLGFFLLGAVNESAAVQQNAVGLTGYTTEAWGAAARGAELRLATTANGATSRTERIRLSAAGELAPINGGQIVVTTGAGAPSSTPSDGALYVDTTNHKLYFRSGGSWRGPLG